MRCTVVDFNFDFDVVVINVEVEVVSWTKEHSKKYSPKFCWMSALRCRLEKKCCSRRSRFLTVCMVWCGILTLRTIMFGLKPLNWNRSSPVTVVIPTWSAYTYLSSSSIVSVSFPFSRMSGSTWRRFEVDWYSAGVSLVNFIIFNSVVKKKIFFFFDKIFVQILFKTFVFFTFFFYKSIYDLLIFMIKFSDNILDNTAINSRVKKIYCKFFNIKPKLFCGF